MTLRPNVHSNLNRAAIAHCHFTEEACGAFECLGSEVRECRRKVKINIVNLLYEMMEGNRKDALYG